jgi:thiol-disulfide isomerase/thioredoxin
MRNLLVVVGVLVLALGCASGPPAAAVAGTGSTGKADDSKSVEGKATQIKGATLPTAQLEAAGMVSDGQDSEIDFTGVKATVLMKHKASKSGVACVPEILITAALDDQGLCKLELEFRAGFDASEGLELDVARFHASVGIRQDGTVIDTIKCKQWKPTASIKGEIIYTKAGGNGLLKMKPAPYLSQPNAAEKKSMLKGVTLAPEGTVTMKFKGKQFTLDLSKLSFKGDAISNGFETLKCAKETLSIPDWASGGLEDVNTDSKSVKEMHNLNDYLGRRIVVMMGAGWCASCISQAKTMQKVKDELEAGGRDDFVMLAINDGKNNVPEITTKAGVKFPVFAGAWSNHTWDRKDPATKAGKNDAFVYDKDGRRMGKFEGAGTVYMGEFENFVRANLNAKAVEDAVDCFKGGAPNPAGACKIVE